MTVHEIRALIDAGKVIVFYKSDEWLGLRDEVLEEYHYECQRCLSQGILKRADMVHHVNEIKNRPDLALKKTYIDADGKEQINLLPLCNQCHNVVHDKFAAWRAAHESEKFTNEERW